MILSFIFYIIFLNSKYVQYAHKISPNIQNITLITIGTGIPMHPVIIGINAIEIPYFCPDKSVILSSLSGRTFL